MSHYEQISIGQLEELMHDNAGFHDAEIGSITVDPDNSTIALLLVDLVRFNTESERYLPSLKRLQIRFDGAQPLTTFAFRDFAGYGIENFSFPKQGIARIQTVMGTLDIGFHSLAVRR
jgi:hypothetical protein